MKNLILLIIPTELAHDQLKVQSVAKVNAMKTGRNLVVAESGKWNSVVHGKHQSVRGLLLGKSCKRLPKRPVGKSTAISNDC